MGKSEMQKRYSSAMEFEDMKLPNDVLKDPASFPQLSFHRPTLNLNEVAFRRTGQGGLS